jgi:DNA-binding winged helix-turn-helix (wHTH) protein
MMASSGCFSMSPAPKTPTTIRFEGYELDQSSEELRKDGNSLKLQPQPFKVLAFLASRPGELVTRNELREHLWPGDTFVDFDLAINQAIKQIRAILCDDADRPRMIATLPRRGYRFIAKAELATAAESEQLSNGSYPSSTASGTIVNELGRDRSRKLQWVYLELQYCWFRLCSVIALRQRAGHRRMSAL